MVARIVDMYSWNINLRSYIRIPTKRVGLPKDTKTPFTTSSYVFGVKILALDLIFKPVTATTLLGELVFAIAYEKFFLSLKKEIWSFYISSRYGEDEKAFMSRVFTLFYRKNLNFLKSPNCAVFYPESSRAIISILCKN